jgi:hypothetical protein
MLRSPAGSVGQAAEAFGVSGRENAETVCQCACTPAGGICPCGHLGQAATDAAPALRSS